MRLDLIITAEHKAWIQNYIRITNARLSLVDHKENSHPAFPLILTLLEKQDRHFIVMFTCWSTVTNWIHYISSFSPSFICTELLISGTQKREVKILGGYRNWLVSLADFLLRTFPQFCPQDTPFKQNLTKLSTYSVQISAWSCIWIFQVQHFPCLLVRHQSYGLIVIAQIALLSK